MIRVQRDMDTSFALGNNATPTFYVNGTKLDELPASTSDFAVVIQDALAAVDAAFAVNRLTGELEVLDPSQLDYETTPSQSVAIRVTDSEGIVSTFNATVNLNNLNDQPTGATLSSIGVIDEALTDEFLL